MSQHDAEYLKELVQIKDRMEGVMRISGEWLSVESLLALRSIYKEVLGLIKEATIKELDNKANDVLRWVEE